MHDWRLGKRVVGEIHVHPKRGGGDVFIIKFSQKEPIPDEPILYGCAHGSSSTRGYCPALKLKSYTSPPLFFCCVFFGLCVAPLHHPTFTHRAPLIRDWARNVALLAMSMHINGTSELMKETEFWTWILRVYLNNIKDVTCEHDCSCSTK